MKKKIILTSVLSIALLASLATGATYALFTSEAKANVAISTATVKVSATLEDLNLSSTLGTNLPQTTATIADNTLTLGNFVPGDVVTLNIRVKNESTIDTKYRTILSVVNDNGLIAGLEVKVDNELVTKKATYSSWETLAVGSEDIVIPVKIALPDTAGDEFQGKEAQLGFAVEAVQGNAVTSDYVAQDSEELEAAVEAGGLVELVSDIDLEDDSVITLAKGEEATIDLNGHTLSGVSTNASTSKLFNVANDATLSLVGDGEVVFEATKPDTEWTSGYPGYANNAISNYGNLVIDGPTIINKTPRGGASYVIDNYPGSSLTIESGNIIQESGDFAIRMFSSSATKSIDVTINGGTISGRRAIWLQQAGSDTSVAPEMNLTINGGTLSSTDSEYNLAIYSYSYGNSQGNTNVTINGGTFTSNLAFGGGENKTVKENVVVNGGTLAEGCSAFYYLENGDVEYIEFPNN